VSLQFVASSSISAPKGKVIWSELCPISKPGKDWYFHISKEIIENFTKV
jgi:hypothetical protein